MRTMLPPPSPRPWLWVTSTCRPTLYLAYACGWMVIISMMIIYLTLQPMAPQSSSGKIVLEATTTPVRIPMLPARPMGRPGSTARERLTSPLLRALISPGTQTSGWSLLWSSRPAHKVQWPSPFVETKTWPPRRRSLLWGRLTRASIPPAIIWWSGRWHRERTPFMWTDPTRDQAPVRSVLMLLTKWVTTLLVPSRKWWPMTVH